MSDNQTHELALVIGEHHRIDPMTRRDRCTCGHKTPLGGLFSAHIAAMLAPLIEAREHDAWALGYTSGHSRAMRRMSDEPAVEPGTNPYRALDGGQE